jgi:hypothetical protein
MSSSSLDDQYYDYDNIRNNNSAESFQYYYFDIHRWLQSTTNATSSKNATQDTINANQAFNDGPTLRNTLRIYGSLFIVVLVVFCYLRKKFPKVYNLRTWVPHIESPLAKKQYGFFSWIYKLYLLTNTELLDECGMDALCYTR